MKQTLLIMVIGLMLQGCACFYVETDDLTACYCRLGDQSIEYKEFNQESEGKAPSGFLGMLLELFN